MGSMDSQVAIVTGAARARGLGRAIAHALAEDGAAVVLVDILGDELARTAEAFRAEGLRCLPLTADVSDPAQVERMVALTLEAWGRIDILVNNAARGAGGKVAEMAVETWDQVLNINLRGTFLCARAVIPAMRKQGSGTIINISSQAGLRGGAVYSAYATSKTAIIAFSQALGAELVDDGIRVTVILPAGIATDFPSYAPDDHPPELERLTRPEAIAHLVRFLLHQDDSMWIEQVILSPFRWAAPAD